MVLDRADHVARQALAAQLVVELQVERDGVRPGALDLVALERLEDELQVVGPEHVVVAVDHDSDRPARTQRLRGAIGVQPGDRLGDPRHALAEARTEGAVVRLQLPAAELVGLADEAQLLDVQLVAHEAREALERGPLALAGHDDRLAQRLAQVDAAFRARLAAELDGVARHLHLPLEL